MRCPGCGTADLAEAGYTQRCPGCDGAWIDEAVVVGILQQHTNRLVDLPWQPREQDRKRACAVCRQPMQAVTLGTVALDRCPEHGVWFDARELAELLAQSKQLTHEPRPTEDHGFLGLLAKLFGS